MSARPDLRERIAAVLGARADLRATDFAAAIGLLNHEVSQIVLAAYCTDWPGPQDQLREMVVRRSWAMWGKAARAGSFNVDLNGRLADLVISEWYLSKPQRDKLARTARASELKVDYRRWRDQLEPHYEALLRWLDSELKDATRRLGLVLRRRT